MNGDRPDATVGGDVAHQPGDSGRAAAFPQFHVVAHRVDECVDLPAGGEQRVEGVNAATEAERRAGWPSSMPHDREHVGGPGMGIPEPLKGPRQGLQIAGPCVADRCLDVQRPRGMQRRHEEGRAKSFGGRCEIDIARRKPDLPAVDRGGHARHPPADAVSGRSHLDGRSDRGWALEERPHRIRPPVCGVLRRRRHTSVGGSSRPCRLASSGHPCRSWAGRAVGNI